MASIDIYSDWKVDPFSGTSHEISLEEVHLIGEITATPGVYGIVSHQVPYFSGSIGDITAVQVADAGGSPLSGGTTYTEVAFGVSPASDEFRVDYDDEDVDTFYATGRFNFNSSEDGNYVKINYKGLGSILKGRYVLNSVSTVPSNLAIVGDLLAQVDSPHVFNQLDPSLSKQFFDDTSVQVSYGINGKDGKTSLDFTANGTTFVSVYKINGVTTYIKCPEDGVVKLFLRLSQDGSFATGSFRVRLSTYDKDLVSISDLDEIISNTDITTSWKWFSLVFDDMPANAVYYVCRLRILSASVAGIVYLDWLYGGDVSLPMGIAADIMTGTTPGIWRPTDQKGFTDTIWFDTAQSISVSNTTTNYLITDSDKFDGEVKSVLSSTNYDEQLEQYEGSSGTVEMNAQRLMVGFTFANSTLSTNLWAWAELPISYFSSGTAGLRLSRVYSDSSITIYVRGIRLK
jgi:hypothetical protein